jgi:hypothetical protein
MVSTILCVNCQLRYFFAGRTFLADVLDGEQNETVMVAGTENLPGVDQHCAQTDGWEIVLDLEAFDRRTMGDDALQQGAKGGDVPLPVAEVVDVTSFGLGAAGAEGLVEGAISGGDIQVPIENDQRAGYGLNNVGSGKVGQNSFPSWISRP